ncbi:MAG: hypothetical protein K6G26_02285 [Lachnospiraceae bacterium]|nr:hypothetical protein [Lachnospiraceae bacterium]
MRKSNKIYYFIILCSITCIIFTFIRKTQSKAGYSSILNSSNQTTWYFNNSDLTTGNYTNDITTDNMTIYATAQKPVSIVQCNETYGSETFSKCLKLNGCGNGSYRTVEIPVANGDQIEILSKSNSYFISRYLIITDNDGVVDTFKSSPTLSAYCFTYTGESSSVRIMSKNSGINLYRITKVSDETDDTEEDIITPDIPEEPVITEAPVITKTPAKTNAPSKKTTPSVTKKPDDGSYIQNICSKLVNHLTPSSGNVNMPIFVVTFPDNKIKGTALSKSELSNVLFGNNSTSMSTFVNNASYGTLKLTGDVYFYTTKNGIESYKDKGSYEKLAMEILNSVDGTVDYSKYDSDKDGYIDSFTLNIIGNDDYWYGCQATWWDNPSYSLDGVKPYNFIINDASPVKGNEDYYVKEMCHEFGHCMGLPDYYKYNTADFENMKGIAGSSVMEDMNGDYLMVSKLLLGWLKKNDVSVYAGGSKSYTLHSAQKSGECIIVPRNYTTDDSVYTSEFFIIQYDTPDKNMASYLNNTSGLRIIHAVTDTVYEYGAGYFKYNNYSRYYSSHDGIQLVKLVGNGDYMNAGTTINSSTSGFCWYDSYEKATINPGITIKLEKSQESDSIVVNISE